jgi:YbbR domain-containing protein
LAKVRVEAVRWKQLPVEIKFLTAAPLGYAYSEPVITPATVAVSGKTSAVSRVKKVVCAVKCDEGNNQIDETAPVVPVDSHGDVVNGVTLDADRVALKIRFVEAAARKTVIVSPQVAGDPRFPARVTGVSVVPSSVTVEGRPNVLIDLSNLATESIPIESATKTFTREVGLRLPTGVRIVGRSNVQVTIQISTPK